MARPATGSVRCKKGNWYASLPPAPGQPRDEVPFGPHEQSARNWLAAAMAARAAGAPVPDPIAFGSVRRQSGSSSAAAPVAPAVRSGHVRAVRGLEAAFVHGRGHDLDALFELWKPFYYRDLEAGGADREIAVEQHWAGYLSPWLSDHARKHGVGDQYCVEELHRLVVAELRAHLKAHQPEQTPPLPTGPVLLGELTIAEAVERYRIPKSTLARYVRQEMVPSHLGAAWNGRRTQAASALSTESLAHLALPRLVGDRAVVDRLSG